ncbi:MAG: AEC family transporter [Pseudomonadota bacterium]
MLPILLKTLPFFALIGLGYGAGRTRFFTPEATAYLTRFVFYFALSAMLFRFSANLDFAQVWDLQLIWAYLLGTGATWWIAILVGRTRLQSMSVTAIEAQCAAIGNVGFLGVPMLTLLLGSAAIGPIMLALAVDLIVFSSLIVILITASREGGLRLRLMWEIPIGLAKNPMIVSISSGLIWSSAGLPIPQPLDEFLLLLGAAATPGALFAIGASLADKSAERLSLALWLSTCKLLIHPALVAVAVLYIFDVDPFAAGVVIAAAAMPVAGNVYILAQHYGIAPQRASAAILVSTMISVVTLTAVIAWVQTF